MAKHFQSDVPAEPDDIDADVHLSADFDDADEAEGGIAFPMVDEDEADGLVTLVDSDIEGAYAAPAAVEPSEASGSFEVLPADELRDSTRDGSSHVLPKIFGGLVLLLGAAYVAGSVFFMSHFMPNTTLNGHDVSLKSVEDVTEVIAGEASAFQVPITGARFDLTIDASDIDLAIDARTIAEQAHEKGQPWAWPLELTRKHDLDARSTSATFDADKLAKIVNDKLAEVNESAAKPKDASIVFDEESKLYKIVPEQPGDEFDPVATLDVIARAVSELSPTIELGDSCMTQPKVLQNDPKLVSALEEANRYLQMTIPLSYRSETPAEVLPEQIREWVSLGDDLTVKVDVEKIHEWTSGALSEKLDTINLKRTYTRPDGKQVSVEGGSYGWIIDGETLAKEIAERMRTGDVSALTVPTLQEGATAPDGGNVDWGNTYVDVDLTEQHVRYYKGGQLVWESDCVSGNTSQNHGTPTGCYKIMAKERNVVLVGEPLPGETKPEYETPVDYWMPFRGNSWGLHDANWRSSFGGNIYTYSGSHGCVNLPPAKAAELYDMVSVGDAVITHY